VRIARFAAGDDEPRFGLVGDDNGTEMLAGAGR
jgi:hypothetical protein